MCGWLETKMNNAMKLLDLYATIHHRPRQSSYREIQRCVIAITANRRAPLPVASQRHSER